MRNVLQSIPIAFVLCCVGSMLAHTISFLREFNTPATEQAIAVAADGSGMYVLGNIPRTVGTPGRAGVTKYDSRGNQLWTREIIAPEQGGVGPLKMLADPSGVYVLGSISQANAAWLLLRKYSPAGDELWTRRLEGLGSVALNDTGVYAATITRSAAPGGDATTDVYLRKYSADGVEQWVKRWNAATNPVYPMDVTVDTTGIYTFGTTGGQVQFARKHDLAGNQLWTREVSRFYRGAFRAAFPSGFYLSALEFGSGGVSLRKYGSNGNLLWMQRVGLWNDLGGYGPPDVVADATGVYVAGGNNLSTALPGHCRSGSAGDSFVRKYSADGAELWTRQFGTAEGSIAHGVAVDESGLYVAGQMGVARFDLFGPLSRSSAYLAKFDKVPAVTGRFPRIFPDCVVNAASHVGGGVAPGEIITIYGTAIGPVQPALPRFNADGRLATDLAETRILIDGAPAPLLYVSDKQSSAIVPYAVSGRTSVDVHVEYRGTRSEPVTVPVLASRPGIFSVDGSGFGQGAILNEDGTVNSALNPARRGSIVSIFATGGGETAGGIEDGQIVTGVAPTTKLPVSVLFDVGQRNIPAELLYVGGVPGSVAGLLQMNVRVPGELPYVGDAVHFVVVIGSRWTGFQVTLALR